MTMQAPYRVMLPSLRGMGASSPGAAQAAQYTQIGLSAAAPAAAILASGGVASILGITAAAAVPIIGAALAGITTLVTTLIANSGCGQTCIETSQWANQAEPVLAKNILAYFALPTPRTQSQQNAALANFLATWQALVNACGQPGTGDAGKRCISDRQSGACTWKQTTTSPLLGIPGEPQPGECWNWWSGYHDPIANDPDVVPDYVASSDTGAGSYLVSSGAGGSASSSGLSPNVYLYGAAALLGAYLLFGGKN